MLKLSDTSGLTAAFCLRSGGWLPDGSGMTTCGKKPAGSAALGALSFILMVQSVEQRKI